MNKIMKIRLTITMEADGWEKPILVGGVMLQSGMTVYQIKEIMREASHFVEQRLVENNLLGIL